MDEGLRSAIVGYWRSGAKLEEISLLTGINFYEIKRIITAYELSLSLKN